MRSYSYKFAGNSRVENFQHQSESILISNEKINILHKVHFARALAAIRKLTDGIYAMSEVSSTPLCVGAVNFWIYFIFFLNKIERERMNSRGEGKTRLIIESFGRLVCDIPVQVINWSNQQIKWN